MEGSRFRVCAWVETRDLPGERRDITRVTSGIDRLSPSLGPRKEDAFRSRSIARSAGKTQTNSLQAMFAGRRAGSTNSAGRTKVRILTAKAIRRNRNCLLSTMRGLVAYRSISGDLTRACSLGQRASAYMYWLDRCVPDSPRTQRSSAECLRPRKASRGALPTLARHGSLLQLSKRPAHIRH